MNGSKEKARLDPNRECKPKTEIVKIHTNDGKCIGPQTTPEAYEIRNTAPIE